MVDLFSPTYRNSECRLCLYTVTDREKMQDLDRKLKLPKLGCCFKTRAKMLLETESLPFSVDEICGHFDRVFGNPMCGYNCKKTYDFFAVFNESTNDEYLRFIHSIYKNKRVSSVCPYALFSSLVFMLLEESVGELSNFKKKHDFLWMFNCLSGHGIRFGKLQ